MKVKVTYVWDSETNTLVPDDGEEADVCVQPTPEDSMQWKWYTSGRKAKEGEMGLTRGFEMRMYLAGLANDAATHASK